jgi:hypothetical protein
LHEKISIKTKTNILVICICAKLLFFGYSIPAKSISVNKKRISFDDSVKHGLAGVWEGKLFHAMNERTDSSYLKFEIRESASSFIGVWQSAGIENGLSELSGFFFDGKNFHFKETNGRYVSGFINDKHMSGKVSWGENGKPWANIELVLK